MVDRDRDISKQNKGTDRETEAKRTSKEKGMGNTEFRSETPTPGQRPITGQEKREERREERRDDRQENRQERRENR